MSKNSYKKGGKKCLETCKLPVTVNATVNPKVECHRLDKHDATFDIAVDFTVKPKCEVVCVREEQCGCTTRCIWKVKVDFDCNAHPVCSPCNKPSANYLVVAQIEADPDCKQGKPCVDHDLTPEDDCQSEQSETDCSPQYVCKPFPARGRH